MDQLGQVYAEVKKIGSESVWELAYSNALRVGECRATLVLGGQIKYFNIFWINFCVDAD